MHVKLSLNEEDLGTLELSDELGSPDEIQDEVRDHIDVDEFALEIDIEFNIGDNREKVWLPDLIDNSFKGMLIDYLMDAITIEVEDEDGEY